MRNICEYVIANITSNNYVKIKAEQLYSFYFFENIVANFKKEWSIYMNENIKN